MENKISDMRMKYNMTQVELAGILQVSRQTIISLEKGKYNPSIKLAYKIARAFDATIEEIFIFEEEGNDD